MLLGAAREHDTVVAYAAANHRADNATSAPTIRDADASMRPIRGRPASAVPAHRDGLRLAVMARLANGKRLSDAPPKLSRRTAADGVG